MGFRWLSHTAPWLSEEVKLCLWDLHYSTLPSLLRSTGWLPLLCPKDFAGVSLAMESAQSPTSTCSIHSGREETQHVEPSSFTEGWNLCKQISKKKTQQLIKYILPMHYEMCLPAEWSSSFNFYSGMGELVRMEMSSGEQPPPRVCMHLPPLSLGVWLQQSLWNGLGAHVLFSVQWMVCNPDRGREG